MNKQTLFLITAGFPFGNTEEFIYEELNQLCKTFHVVIISCTNNRTTTRPVPLGIEVFIIDTKSTFIHKIFFLPALYILHCNLILQLLIHEIAELKRLKISLTFPILKMIIHDISKGIEYKNHFNKIVKKFYQIGNLQILYSFWMSNLALGVSLMDRKYIKIARIHGSDLFFELTKYQYLSFQKFKSSSLDKIFFVSQDGFEYWERKFSNTYGNLEISKLSTPVGAKLKGLTREYKLVVSCASLIHIKRVHLIIEALSFIEKISVRWVHFGGGGLLNKLTKQAEELLGEKENIQFKFMGQTKNNDILTFYAQNIPDLFVHTSFTEGLPIAAVEASSYSIPILGLNAGGVKEVASPKNGKLLPLNASPKEIADSIAEILMLSEEQSELLRLESYKLWQSNHNPEINNQKFIQSIQSIIEKRAVI